MLIKATLTHKLIIGILWVLFFAPSAVAGETTIEKRVPLINAPQKLNGAVKKRFEQALQTEDFRKTAHRCASVFLYASNILYEADSDNTHSKAWFELGRVAMAFSMDLKNVSKNQYHQKAQETANAVNAYTSYLKKRYEETADHVKPTMILQNMLPCMQTAISFVVPDKDSILNK